MDMVSGIVRVMGYPRAAATKAKRDAGVAAGRLDQFFARLQNAPLLGVPNHRAPMRHFTENAGFRASILASTVALAPSSHD